MTIADKIKNLRLEKRQLQKEFGKSLGVNQQTVSSWENGLINPPFETLKRIAEYCGVTMSYFSGEKDDDQKDNVSELLDSLLAKGIIKDPDNISEPIQKMIIDAVRMDLRMRQLTASEQDK